MLLLSPFSLSGGKMKIVALASALARRLHDIILDEPITGLVWIGKQKFSKLSKKHGTEELQLEQEPYNIEIFSISLKRSSLSGKEKYLFMGAEMIILKQVVYLFHQ